MTTDEIIKALDGASKFLGARADMAIGEGKMLLACWERACREAKQYIEKENVVNKVTPRHGRWLENSYIDDPYKMCWQCAICKNTLRLPEEYIMRYRYCPYCGAKMDGKVDE